MKFDILGRINNMRLPDGKTAIFYSIYEGVSNSIHAISDRFKKENVAEKGEIGIWVDHDSDGNIECVTITDNGVGFTPKNLDSFETSDSRFKSEIGGKGVGRFIWFKTFEDISVQSTYLKGKGATRIGFDFDPTADSSIVNPERVRGSEKNVGSEVTLSGIKIDVPKIQQASYLKDLALHFFPQFVTGQLPKIDLYWDYEPVSLNDFMENYVATPSEAKFTVQFEEGDEEFVIEHMYVDKRISKDLKNSYILTAHDRLVGDPISIEKKYALNELADGDAYVAMIRGSFLDERVDQERLGFQLTSKQQALLQKGILRAVETYLSDHILVQKEKKKNAVEAVLTEHPQLASQIDDMDEYVDRLYAGMEPERIAQNLFVNLFREEENIRKEIDSLAGEKELDGNQEDRLRAIVKELEHQEKGRLIDLTVKRQQVLTAAFELLKRRDGGTADFHYEAAVHDLICPMGEMYRSGEYTKHQLWIVDDGLADHQFFASDTSIRKLAKNLESGKEPDLVFFNPLGFRQEGTQEPITIVEFKRPGDPRMSSDPVKQVLEYIEDLQGGKVEGVDGEKITNITKNTPFRCIIVCELTPNARALLKKTLAQHEEPDGEGYYGWSSEHNAVIRVMSFNRMLKEAERRNKAYFDALGLMRPSAAAQRLAAKRRSQARNQETVGT